MKPLQLLYAESFVSRFDHERQQVVTFAVLVENLAYHKRVEIHYAGADGQWQSLACAFSRATGQNSEVWLASKQFAETAGDCPVGDITFAVHAIVGENEHWDSCEGKNYSLKAEQGLWLAPGFAILNINVAAHLTHEDRYVPVTVAVHHSVKVRKVFVQWTTDHWRNTHVSECLFWRRHWEKHHARHAPFSTERDTTIWVTHLPVEHSYRLEYAVGCEGEFGMEWDNNQGANFVASRDPLRVLTLNLHCGQEENQDQKFSTIARAINELDVDIVCLQEVAEPWEGGELARQANAAHIIRGRLKTHYHIMTEWSHRGFQVYREGSAILSRYEMTIKDGAYVSDNHDENSIHSRRIIMATVQVPYIGPVNVFSIHLSWWKDGFRSQFDRLRTWANERHVNGVVATLFLGDFNAPCNSEGYRHVTANGEFEDQYIKAQLRYRQKLNGATLLPAPHDQRIDYIFLKAGSTLEVRSAKPLFTESDYGRVSDHVGYYAEFEPPL